jgi:hypothetical protein
MKKIIFAVKNFLLLTVASLVLGIAFFAYADDQSKSLNTEESVAPVSCSDEDRTITISTNEQNPVLLAQQNPCPGRLTCGPTYFCGAGSNNPFVCCPSGAPYLCHNDCRCYSQVPGPCNSYSVCRSR